MFINHRAACVVTFLIAIAVFLTVCIPAYAEDKVYDNTMDYMAEAIKCAAVNDMDGVSKNLELRNLKVQNEGLSEIVYTVDDFTEEYKHLIDISLDRDYAQIIIECCVNNDRLGGIIATEQRNAKVAVLGLDCDTFTYDDFVLLAKNIYIEAGSDWLSLDWKMTVGEVVINRVNSPEYPDTIKDVIYQKGQYTAYRAPTKFNNTTPNYMSALAALKLLSGERILNDPSVVFQSKRRQGSGVAVDLYDPFLYGHTYICYSEHPEYYIEKEVIM